MFANKAKRKAQKLRDGNADLRRTYLTKDDKARWEQAIVYIGDVATMADLPSGAHTGDVYKVLENKKLYEWKDDGQWHEFGGAGDEAKWGHITGDISEQTDLVEKLDEKLDKVEITTTYDQVYAKTPDGSQGMYSMGKDVAASLVVKRDGDGCIYTHDIPTKDNEAVSKKYAEKVKQSSTEIDSDLAMILKPNNTTAETINQVYFNTNIKANPSTGTISAKKFVENEQYLDDKYVKKVGNPNDVDLAYIALKENGGDATVPISTENTEWTLARRDNMGRVRTTYPQNVNDATNKFYVDQQDEKKVDKVENAENLDKAYITKANSGGDATLALTTASTPNAIPRFDEYGNLKTSSPLAAKDAVNLSYFKNNIGDKTQEALDKKINNEVVVDELPSTGVAHTVYLKRIATGVYKTYLWVESLSQYVDLNTVDPNAAKEIGDIVMGATLTSEAVVISRYGGNSWQQLKGGVFGVGGAGISATGNVTQSTAKFSFTGSAHNHGTITSSSNGEGQINFNNTGGGGMRIPGNAGQQFTPTRSGSLSFTGATQGYTGATSHGGYGMCTLNIANHTHTTAVGNATQGGTVNVKNASGGNLDQSGYVRSEGYATFVWRRVS